MIKTQQLCVSYGKDTVIENLDLEIPEGKITALIGPNGSGKSTLLKTLCRINKGFVGHLSVFDKPIQHYADKELAKYISLLPQVLTTPEDITVRRLVEYGRSPYLSYWGKLTQDDHQKVDKAIEETQIQSLVDKKVDALSGGQRQRVWIAMVLAQDTPIVMLDEPTTYLDLSHQVELMKLIQKLNAKGKTIIVVLHDLNQACRYCDHLVVLKSGKVATTGSPEHVFTESLLRDVFDLDAVVMSDPISNKPMCINL
ncbi:iron-dicitrate transporter ATP-binding subunit [Vibrio orientalis CIP 102891 = ATCC 33934]|uniref:Ferrichrome ABC transporter (ATP binding subunit) PvuE n=1 Tax=Vibrio orientalis CIP 102891 = ATCC 33934 TaxID=675816 RepID=C9QF42_VIBOR|nr:Fe(3+) dicitrate ABC transporter ATP-binding protein FecE [Vibrio orientalis]EEX94752.1 ferrichrome ABC transporter (ATP binding subunit) PvuE [Vibrio orientalis CIP 102891 = ATCC 33934]EGU51451.1 iron-dicitrate transporter ATP-binding subunit [Vibrio orientalis CIP 102891 = ATCC 33934]